MYIVYTMSPVEKRAFIKFTPVKKAPTLFMGSLSTNRARVLCVFSAAGSPPRGRLHKIFCST